MANYNCTQLGCVQDPTGTYPDLQSCQSACIGWGCPPQLTTNTDILFVYDNSGSYNTNTGMDLVFKATTAWTETLAQAGWVGTARHTFGSYTNKLDNVYYNDDGLFTTISQLGGVSRSETWLSWGAVPYFINPGTPFTPSSTWGISGVDLQEYWFKYDEIKPTLTSSNQSFNTGMTIPTNDVLVVSFCHENSYYGTSGQGPEPNQSFKVHYSLWDHVWQNRTTNFTPKGYLMPLLTNSSNDIQTLGNSVYQVALEGLMSIYNGNQDDVTNGGTGTIDGTWILTPSGSSIPNSFGTCDIPSITPGGSPNPTGAGTYTNPLAGCLTVPGGLGTTNPCIFEPGNSSNGWADRVLCPGSVNNVYMYPKLTTSNPYWLGGQPQWGGLEDKGWGAKVDSMVSISQTTLSNTLNTFIGTVATPATVCISAETLYTANIDYPYQDLLSCNNVCFPLLDPWYCDGLGTPCYQDPLGTFTFGFAGTYATSQDAYTACTAQCNTISGWSCNGYGCFQESGDTQFDSLSACTADCQSYSCTTNGCYGPIQGTGETGTYLEMSSCTATCYHFECVTSSYAASILPNIYSTGNTGTNGCVQLSGSVGTSPNSLGFNEYATLSACTGSCISWGCCEPLGITDNSVMYVYYDITSMDNTQTENAIKGIIDWTEIHTEFTGEVHHILIWSERWLAYPSIAYTGKIRRFGDGGAFSSYPNSSNPSIITYDAGASFGTTSYGHSSGYWTGTNSPANVLASIYNVTSGIDYWTSPGQYTGLATHTVYDSFTPGTNLGTYRSQAAGYYTQGYDNLPISLPTDDVINVVFQDESYSMYHPDSMSWGTYPVSYYQLDHSTYFSTHDVVTATTLNNNQGGTLRSFLYPTLGNGSQGQSKGFALHSIAAISSGDKSTPDGSWQTTTYPLNNQNNGFVPPYVHAECEFNLSLLTTTNPYWTGTAPTWGGLDQFGWFINFRFDTYSQAVFETDLTTFLSATTISCDTFCSSATTAPTLSFPYTSQTECNPQCVDYNCGDNGCYTAATGEYSSLSACTASCYSYSCSTAGCADHNPPTGTTFPYVSTDGASYYSYYGSGGTFSSNTDCQLVCNSWDCGQGGCYLQVGGTGGTYSSETHCQINCSGYNCDNQYGCIPEIGNDAQFDTLIDCQTGCTHYECNALLGCIEVTGLTTGSIYEFETQTACTQYCASFNCGVNGCYELGNLSGTFQDINQLPIISSAACTASCVSYNCLTSGCSEVTGTGGTFSSSASCDTGCLSYSCNTVAQALASGEACSVWNVPNYGTGGTFSTATGCTDVCNSWVCGLDGCQVQAGTAMTAAIGYSTLALCLTQGFDPVTGTCTTWNCSANGCLPVTGTSGQFSSLASCTGVCTSYSCSTGTMSEGSRVPGSGGCDIYNAPNYGTGGTFFYLWECSGGCRSWDCTSTGCTEVSNNVGSGGTYLTAFACDSGCTSYNCGDTGCTSQVGSGGTYFNSINPDWGSTACTATCVSYNCDSFGCLQYNVQGGGGSGGTFYNATAPVSALTACTASCISYECQAITPTNSGGCTDIQGTGATGTFTSMSSCTGTCISWGCLNNPVETDSEIYAYYDTTSMDFNEVKNAITGLENWTSAMQNFTGNLYHTLVNDERWLSWGSSVYHSQFTAGTSTIFQNPTAMLIHDWASGLSMTNVYDNMAPGNSTFLFPGITTTGPAPEAAHTDDVLVITFIDESGPSNGLNTNNVYTSDDAGSVNNSIPNFAALLSNPLDQPTPTWKVDFTAYSATYATVTTAGGSLNCFMYPTESFQPQSPDNQLFALHVVAAIDSGNQAVGSQGENWQTGTAPRRLTSGGILGGVPELCAIADLTALEVSNPYLLSVDAYTPNVGKLDTKGWGYNINFLQYNTNTFNIDLGGFLNIIQSNDSLCVSANTTPTSQYPYSSLSSCTANCYSFECTVNGCVQVNGTGGTPTYYSNILDCQSACTSWNCTTTACTIQTGTGGTFTSSEVCVTACTSYNCEDITTYTPSQSWPSANGCIEQTGSGGTFYGAAAGSSGSSIFGFTACTDVCQSFNCLVSCTGGTTGCTSWPNTAATYTTLSSCTANCSIDWYCTESYIANTCSSQVTISGINAGLSNIGSWNTTNYVSSGYGILGYFGDPNNTQVTGNQYDTWGNFAFSLSAMELTGYGYTLSAIEEFCDGPLIGGDLGLNNIPGYLVNLQSIQWGGFGPLVLDALPQGTGTPPFPRDYYDWVSMISDFASLGANVTLSMTPPDVFSEIIAFGNQNNTTLTWTPNFTPCLCYEVPCDVFCDDGYVTIPSTAQGPFTSSGAAESACCTSITYSCVTATTIDSCSGKTTLPNQYNSTSDAWDWLSVNLPNTNLTTLAYESTTPAVNVTGACSGPNGGVLYEISPVTYSLLNPNVSYNTWNLFINQMQAAGTTGILSGMSYSNVNNYVYAQSGQTIKVCDEICHCSVTPCECIELYDGTGQYTTYADCISGTTGLPACCPDTGTTSATSWDCTSGITFLPICDTKPFIGTFNDQFTAVDYFRIGNPTGVFGHQRMVRNFATNNSGVNVPMIGYSWADVQSNTNSAYQWQSCYKQQGLAGFTLYYLPYEYVKSISHPAVTGGLEYTNWNAFYTAAAASFTLTTSLNALQVCQSIDSQYWGSNIFGCVVDMGTCCNREDCFCYETYTTGGTFFTETQCEDPLSGCCPTYSGWTCESIDPITNAITVQLPCYLITQGSPITLLAYTDNAGNGFDGETECNSIPECNPVVPGEFWSCVTTEVNTCDPDGSSLGEITGTTLGPNMNDIDFTYGTLLGTNTQYPFSSSTDQLWPLLQPTSSSIGSYLGGYGQVETILTDYHYYDPYTPLSSTTFQLGSVNTAGSSIVHPNDGTAVYPLPYTLPEETCMGGNATGGTGMPIFNILSVSHRDINSNTPYGSWGEFIEASILLGYSVTTANTVADFGAMYPVTFGCSETTITTQGSGAWYSGCNWTFDMVPCLCDVTCCCESGFTQGYNTEPECLDPVSGCCPSISSYTCTINGCIDPGNGSGEYTGITAFADCESVCKEWTCISSTTITDSCSNKVMMPSLGLLPDISEFAPSFTTGNRGPFDALAYFCDPSNGLQGATFDQYKWDCGSGCGSSVDDCDAPFGAYKFISGVRLIIDGVPTPVQPTSVNNWADLINWFNTNGGGGQALGYNLTLAMDYNEVAQALWWGGPTPTQPFLRAEFVPQVGSCICNPGPCGCVLTGGTGHSGTYHLITGATQCEWDCCSGVTIPECAILITGQEEGVLYYDFDSNSTTKLFDTPPYQRLDIAARQNKLWVYGDLGAIYEIKEYDVVYSPYFQYVFNRNISVLASNMGRGLTPTDDPNILLTANDKVYKIDITANVASTAYQFDLPSGLTCTGDIMYDNVTGNMVITYGSGTTQYVGRFDSGGVLLEESHINTTTPGIGVNESIDSLFNYGTWTPGSYPLFNVDGPIYGITTERRVIELLTNPLQFAPVEAQTLTLVNQITNKVHGATNIFNVVNGEMHGCVNISGDNSSDVYWCDGMLGCLPYPSNVTPPNSFGPHLTLTDCETNCNFVCGDCVASCECTLVTTPISPSCDAEPTMVDCIAQNQTNTNIIEGGDGCCDCFACQSVTFTYWDVTNGLYTQQTLNTNISNWGNFASPWSPVVYNVGDVVLFMDPAGNECCYTLVYGHYNDTQTPFDAYTEYLNNLANGAQVYPGGNNNISWVACDEDCPTIITWSCVTGTTSVSGTSNSSDTCGTAVDTGAGGLSFTPQIEHIAYGGYSLWNTPFEDLKWDCGSQQNPLPTNPCPALIGHWAKILGCRITHITGVQATVSQGMIQTTWTDFIDQINGLQGGSVYNFSYGDRWQDLEAILGSQSYDGSPVPGNSVDIECIWEYCVCDPNISGCDLCMSNVWNYGTSTTPNYVPMVDISTNYYGGALGDGTLPYTFNDRLQAIDIITDPANGLFNTNFTEMKWEKMPLTGPGGQPLSNTANGCSPTTLTGLGYPDCTPFLPDFGVDGGNYRKFTQWGVGSGNLGGPWDNWADLLNDVGSYINAVPGVPSNVIVTSSDSYSELDYKIFWYLMEIGVSPNTNWSTPNNLVCGCTGQTITPSYDPCHCEPINGPGGYPTSAMCEEVCCSGETSWSCNTGTTIAVTSSVNCGSRVTVIPNQMTNPGYFSNQNPIGFIANPANGFQNVLFSDLKYVSDGTLGANSPNTDKCFDVNNVMTPDGVARWEHINEINAFTGTLNPVVSTLSWADFINQLQLPPHNLPVSLSMTAAQVFGQTQSIGYSLDTCSCPGDPCGCVEIPGTFGYPTQASCEVICCPLPTGGTLYDCTLTGCIPSLNGTFNSLIDCEELCREWVCDEGDCIGSCDIGGNNTPRTELPSWLFGIPEDIIGYVASQGTSPVQSLLLPPIVSNMQQADIRYYKFDCVNCSSPAQTCPSPNGTWFAPGGMYIENTLNASPFTYSGPHNTWQDVVIAAQNQGFTVSTNTTFTDFKTQLQGDLRRVVLKGKPCFGQPSGCDCIVIDGTGHTDAWEYTTSNYQPCVDACCSGETFDCTLQGCVPNLNGFGSYTSMSACTGDCKEYQCIPGVNTVDSCSGQTLLNVDWTTAPPISGFFDQKQLAYLADPLNSLQSTPVTNWKWFNQNGPIASSPSTCTHTIISAGTTYDFELRKFKTIRTVNNSFSQSNAVFTNADNYDPGTNTCTGSGCEFSTWTQLITGCNIMGVLYNGSPLTLNSPFMDVRIAISSNWGISGSVLRLDYSFNCYCSGTACGCLETPGTGHTGNFYSDLATCNVAANANPCCQPPENWWTCEPGKPTGPSGSGLGTLQGECVCVQGVSASTPGSYASLQECKDNPNNCCDENYYDCINENTPQAGCVGLIAGVVGPYQTAALCDQDCPKLGYDCKIVDDGPGGSGSIACVPCVGFGCQYTHITAVGAPYYGDALQQCQDSCPADDCWKCCMDKNGYITQLSPSLSPAQCKCPLGTVEVQCDGSGPCPYPVSCLPGYYYDWTLCKCVCEQSQSCIPGYHWSFKECKCVPNSMGPVDFVGSEGEVLESITEFKMIGGVRNIINEFVEGTQLLEYMARKGFYLGRDECTHCTDGVEGICVLDGCLYYPNYEKDGNSLIGWKSLLVDGGNTASIMTNTCTPISVSGYYPLYTTASCAEIHVGGNGTYHTHTFNYVTYYMPNGLGGPGSGLQFHGDYIGVTPILTGVTLNGYSCVDNPDNPPTYTECLEFGTAPYLAYFGNAAPQYATLQECYAAGCDFSGNTYYQCSVETNTLVGENQQACVPVDGVGGVGLYTTLEDCLNSGCSGWMACDTTQVSEVNGIVLQDNSIYPIPMCCESYINTATIPLTVTDCENHCSNMNETWFPLYNVIGINTFYESPLGYLLRELNPYVRNGSCAVSLTQDSIGRGRVQRSEYNMNY